MDHLKTLYDKTTPSLDELKSNYDTLKLKEPLSEEAIDRFYHDQVLVQLMKKPNPKARKLFNHYSESQVGHTIELDLLMMPNDKGNKYILTGVDIASRFKYGKEIKNKQPQTILEAFKTFKVKPKQISTDGGGEFKGIFNKFLEENNIKHFTTKPSNHLGHVEALNKSLAMRLFKIDQNIELIKGKDVIDWVKNLQTVLEILNSKRNTAIKMKPVDANKKEIIDQPKNIFTKADMAKHHPLNATVRRLLNTDEVLDIPSQKITVQRRRATDPYWSLKTYQIEAVIKTDGLYYHRLKGSSMDENEWYPHLYTFWQLAISPSSNPVL